MDDDGNIIIYLLRYIGTYKYFHEAHKMNNNDMKFMFSHPTVRQYVTLYYYSQRFHTIVNYTLYIFCY